MTDHAALAKVRGRIRREITKAEEEQESGGEINLVPYLDIVVNTVIFLLATVSTTLALANINVNSPRYETTPAEGVTQATEEEKAALNLTVVASYSGFIVAGAGGVMNAPDGSTPTVKCGAPLQQGRCPAYIATKQGPSGEKEFVWVDKYDYRSLQKLVQQIKEKYPKDRQVILSADRQMPYKVLVDTMDILRGNATSKCTGKDGCLFDQVILSAGVQ